MKSILFFVIIFCALKSGISEDSGREAAPDSPVHTLKFRLMSSSGGIWDLYLQPEEPQAKIDYFTVPSHRPTGWFEYTGSFPLMIYKKGETRLVPGENSGKEREGGPRPVSSLNPEASGTWLFLLTRTQDENGGLYFESLAVKDESREYEEGYLVINLSPSELEVQMNDQLHRLLPGDRHHIIATPLDDGTIDLKISEKQKDKWKPVNSNTILLSEQGLTTFLLTKTGDKVEVRRFVDPDTPRQP